MKKYSVEILPEAVADLKKLDRIIAGRILNKIKWLSINFDHIIPQNLSGDFKGQKKQDKDDTNNRCTTKKETG